jgi:hypothetical protein
MMATPSCSASRRLVDAGEEIRFALDAPARSEFRVFPCYLEDCDPERARGAPGRLEWLDDMPSVGFDLPARGGASEVRYRPDRPGNYMARLRTPERTVYRYFAAVDPGYLVYRMLAYSGDQPPLAGPEMRNGGIPIDWALALDRLPALLDPERGYLARLLDCQETFDDLVLPWFSTGWTVRSKPAIDLVAHVDGALAAIRGAGLRADRAVLDWQAYAGSAALYRERGFDVLDGIIAEGEGHRGAPWFPYWISEDDLLSPAPGPSSMLGMIMDFCAGFHFHGPPDFHMLASECDWAVAAPHAETAVREHIAIARNSRGGPVFVPTLLTFGYVPWGRWPARDWPESRQLDFVRSFLDGTAFDHARNHPVVFARCADVADYLRDHPGPQPLRVYASVTHDWPYDRTWSPEWCNDGIDVHRGALPFHESLREIRERRPRVWAKPTSRELIYREDADGQCRFEYACLKPLLWYEYADRTPREPFAGVGLGPAPKGVTTGAWGYPTQGRRERDLPDPRIAVEIRFDEGSWEIAYRISGGADFPGYRLAVWDIPREFSGCPWTTNAREFLPVVNADGDFHGILTFDLKPETDVRVSFDRGGRTGP